MVHPVKGKRSKKDPRKSEYIQAAKAARNVNPVTPVAAMSVPTKERLVITDLTYSPSDVPSSDSPTDIE